MEAVGADILVALQVEWHHGKISREDASSILIEHGPGSYLVRESVSRVDGFSISFRVDAGVKHFKVRTTIPICRDVSLIGHFAYCWSLLITCRAVLCEYLI